MTTSHTRALHFSRVPDTLEAMVNAAADANLLGASATSLMAGTLDSGSELLWSTHETSPHSLAAWCACVGGAGYASILGVTTQRRPSHTRTPADASLLTGSGVCLASAGVEAQPLVDLGLKDLRYALERSRDELSALCGYDVRILFPLPNKRGRALDPLVWREATHVGYTLILHPHTDLLATRLPPGPTRVSAFQAQPDTTPRDIQRWLHGEDALVTSARVLARKSATSLRSWIQRGTP